MDDAQTISAETAIEPAAPEAADDAAAAANDTGAAGSPGPEVGILARLEGLPIAVLKYVMSDEQDALHKTIYDKHGLTQDERDMAYYTELQTFLGEVPLSDFPDVMWNRLPWEDSREAKMTAFVIDILGFVFLPAQAHLGDVAGLIVELGGDLKGFPEKQLEVRRISFKEGAAEIAEVADLGEDDDYATRNRLAFILESRLRHVRTDAGVKEMLMRGKKTGGMDMAEAEADKVIELLETKTRMTTYAETATDEASASVPAEEPEYTADDIKKLYAGTVEEQQAIGKRIDRFKSVTAGEPAKMRDAFYQIISPADGSPIDSLYVVAGLISMAEGDMLSDALTEDDRYRDFIREYLKGKNREGEIAVFEDDPTAAKYMNILLQYFLRGVAGYDDSESARLALRIINLLNKQGYNRLADLVAFDMNEGEFRWTDLVEP